MKLSIFGYDLGPLAFCMISTALAGCVAFDPAAQSKVENFNERPYVAILPFAFDIEITKLSTVKSAEERWSPEAEAIQLSAALKEIRSDARWLFLSFQPVPTKVHAERLLITPLPLTDRGTCTIDE